MMKDRKEYYLTYKKSNYRRVPLDLRIQAYDVLKAHAESTGQTVNGFIKKAIANELKRQLEGTENENLLVVLPLLWNEKE